MGNNNILKKVAQFDERLFLTLFNCNSPKWLKKWRMDYLKVVTADCI
jgi:undecaprenyl-diphosphatase